MILFLGWSILYWIECLMNLCPKLEKSKPKIQFWMLIFLFLMGFYWCVEIIVDYYSESESMDFHISILIWPILKVSGCFNQSFLPSELLNSTSLALLESS